MYVFGAAVLCLCFAFRISELPISIYFNPELRSLNVSHNLLKRLPHAAPGDTASLSQQDYMDLLKAKGAPVLGTRSISIDALPFSLSLYLNR
jgi:hypothetical protein